MIRKSSVVFAVALGLAILEGAALPRFAHACGGCFAPPSENPTVVTDHRMILTVYRDESTLYDQIRYTGSPASFAWVLPTVGVVEVGLSADTVFASIDALTQTQILQPPSNCPRAQGNCPLPESAANAGSAKDGDVTVTKREVVGPYETVQLRATNPTALNDWLATNGFTVPNEVKPVIAAYVTEHFDFLALKLIPGAGIDQMRPVRVTTRGASAVLPLRMVAAGTGPTVGISLWVFGEGRYEPQNFPGFHIANEELVWDWTTSRSNYVDLRAEKTKASNGRGWETESSTEQVKANLRNAITYGGFGSGRGGNPAQREDYEPVKDAMGNVVKTSAVVREEDLTKLLGTTTSSTVRVTRLRADLAHEGLDKDLLLTASRDAAELPNVRNVTREANEPVCVVFSGCQSTGEQLPRSQAIQKTQSNNSGLVFGSGCRTSSRDQSASAIAGIAAALAFAVASIARWRKKGA